MIITGTNVQYYLYTMLNQFHDQCTTYPYIVTVHELQFPCTEYYTLNGCFYLFHFLFSCLKKLGGCSADEEYSSSEVGVVFLDEIYDRL